MRIIGLILLLRLAGNTDFNRCIVIYTGKGICKAGRHVYSTGILGNQGKLKRNLDLVGRTEYSRSPGVPNFCR